MPIAAVSEPALNRHQVSLLARLAVPCRAFHCWASQQWRPDQVLNRLVLAWVALGAAAASAATPPTTVPPQGLRDNGPELHALVGARIVVAPGEVIERGTIVVRDGVIEAVGADVQPPAGARVWDMAGRWIYPGLFDAFSELPANSAPAAGPGYWSDQITPQVRAESLYRADGALCAKLRSQGIAVRLVAPSSGIIRGTSAIVTTVDDAGSRGILREQAALHLEPTLRRANRDEYPNSPMGAYTLVRQALLDAQWYVKAADAYRTRAGMPRPERNVALEALAHFVGDSLPVVIDADDELYFLRADRLAQEFGLKAIIRGSGIEYRRLDAVRASGRAVILPVDFPKPPDVTTAERARAASLEELLDWDVAPENPARLAGAGVRIALCTHGLKDPGTFLAQVRKAVARGLSPEAALRALTVTPAELFGVEERIGTLTAGKAALLVVADGDLFTDKTKVLETWIDGERHEIAATPSDDVRGTWEISYAGPDGQPQVLKLELGGELTQLRGKILRGDQQAPLKRPELAESRLTALVEGKPFDWTGIVQLSATIERARPADADATGDASAAAASPPLTLSGVLRWSDGTQSAIAGKRIAPFDPKLDRSGDTAPSAPEKKPDEKPADAAASATAATTAEAKPAEAPAATNGVAPAAEPAKPAAKALFEVNYPLGAHGVDAAPERPSVVLFKNGTIWTSGPEGTIENGAVLVVDGLIKAVGHNISAPADAIVVDLAGRHVSPGIIDCHSHIATDGGVNESGQAVTAEVRIGDFIDATDVNIYRQLGGGVTSSNILHGSANPIGGQNQIIKLRWGALPEEMKFAEAPPGIKFALGENVKQSNWGERYTTRYPQTRMGVEQIIRDEFNAAREYRRRAEAYGRQPAGLPPRVDLELEAVAEILEGRRLIHCHSYRQDEILALLRTCEEFGVKIGTLQHILEGYKVADAIARHGAGGSSFSDWWAYKFEVLDAIPYNGALMHNAGVIVSFNSDDAELARRLNLEAAKAVKYGRVPPAEALKFVTLNPAKQLRIDEWVGSLEPGKHADLAVWSGSPLSVYSRCEQTWIDGRKYFDREADAAAHKRADERRAALVQKILASGEDPAGPGESRASRRVDWPREDLFCGHHDHEEHGH
ncbi:MAG: amidohydrolase family protein [Pirellulales bacterium]|nr:amidohydrolase family protein [Pirellulales bacterium]